MNGLNLKLALVGAAALLFSSACASSAAKNNSAAVLLFSPAEEAQADTPEAIEHATGITSETRGVRDDELDMTDGRRSICGAALRNNNNGAPYMFMIEVGALTRNGAVPQGPWKVTIQSGANEEEAHEEGKGDAFKLILTEKNTFPGQRLMTPLLNVDMDSYCVTITRGEGFSEPPMIVARSSFRVLNRGGASALSAIGAGPENLPNFEPARQLLADCTSETACAAAYPAKDPPPNPDGSPSAEIRMWNAAARRPSNSGGLSFEARRARLEKAIAPIIWIGIERFVREGGDDQAAFEQCPYFRECMSHCTGFLVAPRLVLTNAHCLINFSDDISAAERADPTKWNVRYFARGWVRPLEGGAFELRRAPDLQALTPIFVGRPFNNTDYALLYIEDQDMPRLEGMGDRRPAPLTLTSAVAPVESEIAIFGYPAENELVGSFDDYCEITKAGPDNYRHKCDTDGGSSGSPVFDRNLSHVFALHYAGYSRDAQQNFKCGPQEGKPNDWSHCANWAVMFEHIREDIGKKLDAAGLWRFLDEDCAAIPPDARHAPVSTPKYEMPVLEGSRGVSDQMIVAAYNMLPAALRPTAKNVCGA